MRLRFAVAAGLLAVVGCGKRAPLPSAVEGEWGAARSAATRRALLYDGLQHRATATATHLSRPVRDARARRLAEWFRWTPQELADRLAREQAEAAEGEEFLLAFFTADPRANDLDAPRSIWRVALKVEGEDVLAHRVTSLEWDANTLGLFPYVGPFDVLYRVLLPPPKSGPVEGRTFVLELSSGLGTVSLDYGVPSGKFVADEPWQPVPPP